MTASIDTLNVASDQGAAPILRGTAATLRQIELLTGDPDTPMAWRVILDAGKGGRSLEPRSFTAAREELKAAQGEGRGVFFVVNEGGHSAAEINRVRAVFIDMDGEKTGGRRWQDMSWHVSPHFLIARDDTHFHAYWLVDDSFPVGRFTSTQKRLIKHYGSDAKVCDLPRIMRLAGSKHLKDPSHPRDIVLVDRVGERAPTGSEVWGAISALRLSLHDVTAGLPELVNEDGSPALKARKDFVVGDAFNVKECIRQVKKLKPAIEGEHGDNLTIETANWLGDFGDDAEMAFERLTTAYDGEPSWNDRCQPPWDEDVLWEKVQSAFRSRQNDIGCKARDPASTRFQKWLELSGGVEPDEAEFFDPWQKPPPPQMPMDVLDGLEVKDSPGLNVGAVVRGLAKTKNLDASPVAFAMLAAQGGLLDQHFALEQGDGHTARPRIFMLVNDPPSSGKGDLFDVVLDPVQEIQSSQWASFYGRQADLLKAGKKEEAQHVEEPRTFIVTAGSGSTTTTEWMEDLQQKQPSGFLIRIDEFSSFIGGLDAYRGGSKNPLTSRDAGFLIASYDGKMQAGGTRGRGASHAKAPFKGVMAAVQPEVVKTLGNLSGNGFLQRFVQISLGPRGPYQRKVDPEAREFAQRYKAILKRTIGLKAGPLYASAEAEEIMADVREELDGMQRADGLYGASFQQYAGRLKALVGSLAIGLHLLGHDSTTMIDAATATAAARIIMEYVLPWGLQLYGESGPGALTSEQSALAQFVLCKTDPGSRLVARDFQQQRRWVFRDTPTRSGEFHAKLEFLTLWGWLLPERKPGHPYPVAYHVHPNLHAALAGAREREMMKIKANEAAIRNDRVPEWRARKAANNARGMDASW